MNTLLSISDVSKTFVSTKALDDVTFTVNASEVHALVGHNGSGKSTLIKILSGFHEPDQGSGPFVVNGETLSYGDSHACHQAGLRFIHQELGLLDDLSVLENLRLGDTYETAPGWRIRWRSERRRARQILSIVGLDLDPNILVSELTPIERTQVAVARALQSEDAVRVLVLDEPTATLPSSEVDRLFELIRRTIAHGVGVVYVSHRLEEIHEISDRVTVLREGSIVGAGPSSEFSNERLVTLIVGETADESAAAADPQISRSREAGEVLKFEGVTAGELREANFTVQT
ncbi:MAG: ATP-binding cassette domain-containing protein, partial [Actinomycetota bacterium]|nr:ATP-binding cassette domain-containing protein [Actinomycetota bacterium]